MIGRLRGVLVEKKPPQLLVDVQGVGYEVNAPMSTFYVLPELGREVTLHTHLVVREDAHLLFGFHTQAERSVFRQLIKVTGIGAKIAVGILSGIAVDDLIHCVQNGDTAALTRIPGIGKKTAERLVVELRDRLDEGELAPVLPSKSRTKEDFAVPQDPVADAVSALVALGYKPQEASRWVRHVNTSGLASEEIIRQALQQAGRQSA